MSEGNGTPPRILTMENGGQPDVPEDELEAAIRADPTLQMGVRAMRRNISRGEAVKFITTAALTMGEKVYQQISAEHARVFAEMEKRLSDRIAVLEGRLDEAAPAHTPDNLFNEPEWPETAFKNCPMCSGGPLRWDGIYNWYQCGACGHASIFEIVTQFIGNQRPTSETTHEGEAQG